MAKDYKYEDSTPVDEPVRKGKVKAVEPGSGIRVDGKPVRASRKFHGLDDDPDEYGSVRQEGFSKNLGRLRDMASDRTKDAVVNIGKGAVKSTMIPGVGSAAALGDFSKAAREYEVGSRARGLANTLQSGADREMADQIRRESRGVKETQENLGSAMKKGGKVSASSRADGCCTKGKTRGKMM